MNFYRPMCRPHAGEALGFGFDHRTTVVVAVGTLLLQFEVHRRQDFFADRLGKYRAVEVCSERMLNGCALSSGHSRRLQSPPQLDPVDAASSSFMRAWLGWMQLETRASVLDLRGLPMHPIDRSPLAAPGPTFARKCF